MPLAIKKYFRFLILIFICCNYTGYSQQNEIDSLKNVLKTSKEDTNKVNTLNDLFLQYEFIDIKKAETSLNKALDLSKRIDYSKGSIITLIHFGYLYEDQGNYLEALKNYLAAQEIARTIGDKKLEAECYNSIGNVYFSQGDYQKAINNHTISLEICRKLGIKKGVANSLLNMGNIYAYMGKYPEALENYFASLKMREEMNDLKEIAGCYTNIGNIYLAQTNYSEALKNQFAALKIIQTMGSFRKGEANAYNNIGGIYYKQRMYSKALENFNISLKIKNEIGDKKGIASSYLNIGSTYSDLNNYPEALKNLLASLEIREAIGDNAGVAVTCTAIGYLFVKEKKFDDAERYLIKAKELSKNIGSIENLRDTYNALARLDSAIAVSNLIPIHKKENLWKSAFENYKMYTLYKDSLNNEVTQKKTIQNIMNYEFDKKQALIKSEQEKIEAIQKEELEKKNTEIKLYISISIIIVILSSGIALYMRNRKRTERLELEKNLIDLEQKALRLQMNPHFIFNALNSIQGFITENDPVTAKKYLAKFAKLMRLILENSAEPTISLQNEIEVLNNYLELTALRFSNKFNFIIDVDSDINTSDVEIPPMLLQPFVENAVLHGIASKASNGTINISFKKKDASIECIIEDDGIGRKQAMEQKPSSHKSTGMIVTEERLKIFGEKNNTPTKLNIIDLIDKLGNACGTRVILEIPAKLSWI